MNVSVNVLVNELVNMIHVRVPWYLLSRATLLVSGCLVLPYRLIVGVILHTIAVVAPRLPPTTHHRSFQGAVSS